MKHQKYASAGNITIVQHGESDEMEIDDSAGDVDVTAESIGKLDIDISLETHG